MNKDNSKELTSLVEKARISEKKENVEEIKKLEQERKYYSAVIKNSNEAIITKDLNGIITSWNSGAKRVYGYSASEVLGKSIKIIFSKDKYKELDMILKSIKNGKSILDYETVRIAKDGNKIDVLLTISPIKDEFRKIIGVSIIGQNITKRKKIEEKLKESEEKYRTVSEKANDGIVIIQDGKILYGNPALGKIYRDSVKNLLGHNFLEYIIPEEKEKIKENYKKRFSGEKIPTKSETILFSKNKDKVYVELNANLIQYKGKLADLVIIRDITERKKFEDELKESEEKFRNIFNVTNDSIFIHDLNSKILEVNTVACEKLKYSKKELMSLSPKKVDSPEFAKFVPIRMKEVLKKGSFLFESAHLTKDGNKFPVEVNAKLILFNGKKAILSICRDITERKKIEEKLKEDEERFHTLFESANDAIWLIDGDKFIECNYQSVKLFKCKSKQDIINHTPMDFSPKFQPDGQISKKKALEYILSAFNGHPQRFYWKHQAKDGTLVDAEISLNSVFINGKKYIQAIGRDITERKIAEQKLIEAKLSVDKLVEKRTAELNKQKNFLDQVLKNIPDMVFVKDAKNLKFELFNDAGEDLFGKKREDLIGKSDYDFFPKEQADFFIKKDREVLNEKKLLDIPEEPIQTLSGNKFLHTKKIPIYDSQGKPEYLLGISEDITERKKLDQAKSQFFSNISHELRTPITPIKAQLQRLLSKELTKEEMHTSFEMMSRNTIRLDRLIQDLLEMTRIQSGRFTISKKKENFNDLLEHAISDLDSVIKAKNVKIIFTLKKVPLISLDRDRLLEVLINLLDNAIKYGGKVIQIDTELKKNKLVVSVRDNGVGINNHDFDNIFKPFYRSEKRNVQVVGGMGLGLAISKEIIESHKGKLSVTSKFGKGSVFTFTLPLK